MRIISGTLASRQFESPGSHKTHPMSDKLRGALFNILGDIAHLSVLDAFAGSGALSFEAVSRGAAYAIAIDQDRQAQKAIGRNITTLGLKQQVKLIKASAGSWLQTNPDARFNLILCDPPYDETQPNLLARLSKCLLPGGLLVLSWPGHASPPQLDLEIAQAKTYGDAQLIFYRAPLAL